MVKFSQISSFFLHLGGYLIIISGIWPHVGNKKAGFSGQQCCGSETERIGKFWLDPNSNRKKSLNSVQMEIYLQPEPYEIQCIKFRYRYSPGIHTPPFHKRCHQGSHKLPAEVILKNAPRMFQSTASNHNQAHNHGKQSLSTVEEAN
jgi:hypothetical protein